MGEVAKYLVNNCKLYGVNCRIHFEVWEDRSSVSSVIKLCILQRGLSDRDIYRTLISKYHSDSHC